jgi:hypothetical protein
MSAEKLGVWEMKVDLRTQLGKSLSFLQHRKRLKAVIDMYFQNSLRIYTALEYTIFS